jgi:hypothetical protein
MASPFRQANEWLFGKTAACLAVALSAAIVLGCMSLSFGSKEGDVVKVCAVESETFEQVGRIQVRSSPLDQTYYYPVPFASRPNLEIDDPYNMCEVVEQKEDCFKVKFHANVTSSTQYLAWKARGVRVHQAAPPPLVETPPATNGDPVSVPVTTAPPKQ